MSVFQFSIEKKISGALGRAGVLETPHGSIETPAFVVVGTKASVKSLSPEQVKDLGAQVVLANTYHLYVEPGDKTVSDAGGLHKFMNWNGPTMTDSGGFQAFSLGTDFGKKGGKISKGDAKEPEMKHSSILQNTRMFNDETEENGGSQEEPALAKITEDGVAFKSYKDGSKHFFTPERSIEIQHNIGADMIFAFDECTSPHASHDYQREAMERTHRWASRSLAEHKRARRTTQNGKQALFGIVQGGRFEDLRKESATVIGAMDFDGFGIGGSFDKEDMYTTVRWVNELLPEEKPRHLLGIGEPVDLFGGIENGCDLFDCVAPTRMARNGTLHTKNGRINIFNAPFRNDLGPIDEGCECYTCSPRQGGASYTRAYVAHLFRSKEMFAATLASIHNLYFIVNLVKNIRQSILDGRFAEFKQEFLAGYRK
ncbi:MAG: tRNA guanosine(34) transglycosylase Tgt [Patescibacteria group bacterium]